MKKKKNYKRVEAYSQFHGVYILHTDNPVAKDNNIYIGYSNDPNKRVKKHRPAPSLPPCQGELGEAPGPEAPWATTWLIS